MMVIHRTPLCKAARRWPATVPVNGSGRSAVARRQNFSQVWR